ncbi:hypothetical protein HK099_005098 [Clydaea vesicula]|uniref:EamA domain-containing protein n=1 Tax=Clydaea vesicula TaxID=447962 RepID=A0AAD5TZJ7_9FUNG|nr:hypothetical protein HK099_005098 [Clydaea vesicula]
MNSPARTTLLGSSSTPSFQRKLFQSNKYGKSTNQSVKNENNIQKVLFHQFIFLLTGLISTLGAQWLNYRKAADSRSLLTVLCTYLGMILIVFLPLDSNTPHKAPFPLKNMGSSTLQQKEEKKELSNYKSEINHTGVISVALLDVFGQIVLTVGLFYIGSGLYQVIYSSVIVFASVYNRVFLKRKMGFKQWMAVLTITFGLSLNALISDGKTSPHKLENSSDQIVLGFLITLFGTSIYSGVYTLNDHLMTSKKSKASPRDQCLWPLTDPDVICAYLILIFSALGHNVTYFELVNCTGAVATGVLQALRAVLVFFLSHYLYCGKDSNQCFTFGKGVSTFFVIIGVLAFAYAKSLKPKEYKLLSSKGSEEFLTKKSDDSEELVFDSDDEDN